METKLQLSSHEIFIVSGGQFAVQPAAINNSKIHNKKSDDGLLM